jgi:hypothetical protein
VFLQTSSPAQSLRLSPARLGRRLGLNSTLFQRLFSASLVDLNELVNASPQSLTTSETCSTAVRFPALAAEWACLAFLASAADSLALGTIYAAGYARPWRATSCPQPLFQTILFQLLTRTRCHTVKPGEQLADCDRVFFLRGLHADRQSRARPERDFRENTPAENGDGFDGGFVEALGRNLDGVLDTFRIGE